MFHRVTLLLFLINQISEILNLMEGYQVCIVCALGVLVARAAYNVKIIAANCHRGIMAGFLCGLTLVNKSCKAPVDAVFREMKHKSVSLVVGQIVSVLG